MRRENPIGKPFFELSEVDSSNNYAMRQVQSQMAEHGTTWFAHYQNAGKGQRGKVWAAEPGQNIMMSIVIDPFGLSIDNQFVLNIIVALACYDFFNKYAIDNVSIKWPNDIFWRDRKAGGVLIENVITGGKWKHAIVGIGININQTLFPAAIRTPVSLKQITGKTFNVISLAKELCECLEKRWQRLLLTEKDELTDEYNLHLYKYHQAASFKKENSVFTGIVAGVNKKGELLINTGKTVIPLGVVEWIFD